MPVVVWVGVGVGDAVGVTVGVGDAEGVAVGVTDAVGVGVGVGVPVPVVVCVGVGVGDAEGVAVGVGDAEDVAVGVTDAVGVTVGVTDPVGDALLAFLASTSCTLLTASTSTTRVHITIVDVTGRLIVGAVDIGMEGARVVAAAKHERWRV